MGYQKIKEAIESKCIGKFFGNIEKIIFKSFALGPFFKKETLVWDFIKKF
jgi:hypothetical protein